MSSGVQKRVTGTVVATGAAMTIEVGFRPSKVVVRNSTTNIMLEWLDTLAAAAGFKTVAAGTRTVVTANGITQTATGFVLGTDSVNVSTNLLHWEAFE